MKVNSIINKLIRKANYYNCKIVLPRYFKFIRRYKKIDKTPNSNVIVSLTTIPSRIDKIWITIESIMNQSIKPDKIILWLGIELFKNVSLPKEIINLQSRGLEVRFCEDLFCHTKYYYTLKENIEADIITIDDDIIYPKNMIKNMIKYSEKFPNCIVCNRAHGILVNDEGEIKKYREWEWEVKDFKKSSHYLLQTGVSGVLYPKGSLHKEVLNKNKFMKLCPKADDLWLKIMAYKNNTKIVIVNGVSQHFNTINGTQEIALNENNVINGANDRQLKAILKEYKIDETMLGCK